VVTINKGVSNMSIRIILDKHQHVVLNNEFCGESGRLHIKHTPSEVLSAEYTHDRSTYKKEIEVFVGSKKIPLLVLKGSIVHSIIESILKNSNDAHLTAIIKGCNSYIDRRKELAVC
tara:strand:- start:1054 stop:1404 length:351 start_codon:yes stop_codon:yes gene_type:complete